MEWVETVNLTVIVVKLLVALALLLILVVIGLRALESRLIFYPMKEIEWTPRDAGLSFEEVHFETADRLKLHGWFIQKEGARFTILLCHGNAGNISHRVEKARIFHDLGLQVFLFDYRGYGRSGGTPHEKGLYLDTLAAYQYLTGPRGISPDALIVYGESIGGAFAIDLAVREPVAAVITESAFTSIPDMANKAFGFFPSFLLPSGMDSLSKIGKVPCRKLIIHAVDDEIVPFSFGLKLYESARDPKKFLKLRGTHNTAFMDSLELYKQGLSDFLGNDWP